MMKGRGSREGTSGGANVPGAANLALDVRLWILCYGPSWSERTKRTERTGDVMGFLALGAAGWFAAVVIAILVVAAGVLWDRGTREAWEEAVEKLGLEFTPHPQSHFDEFKPASGTYRGKKLTLSVRLRIEEARASRRQLSGMRRNHAIHKYYTVVEARLADGWPVDAPRIETRGRMERGLALLGLGIGDFGVDDRELDTRYRFEESPSRELSAFLGRPEVKSALRELSSSFDTVRIDEESLRVEKRGRVANPERLIKRVNRFVDQIKVVDRALGRQSSSTPMPGGGSKRGKMGRIQEWAANRK